MSMLVVLITGCSEGGIGYALAREFKKAGCCRVFASARRLESMAGLAEVGIDLVQLDVTSEESIKAAVDHVISTAGKIDILINNAGALGRLGQCPKPSRTTLTLVVQLLYQSFRQALKLGHGCAACIGWALDVCHMQVTANQLCSKSADDPCW